MVHQDLLRLWQLTDSVFPTGAFAHSYGLETYVARGTVRTAATLEEFITNTLLNSLAPGDGVACTAVYRAQANWEEVVRELDRRLTAMKGVSEFRQASRAMGLRFVRTALQLFALPRAAHYLNDSEAHRLYGHISLAYGLVCHDLDLPLQAALAAWFRHYCASLVSVGVRLIPLGQTEGQVLLMRLGTSILQAVRWALEHAADDMASFAFGQELAGMAHRDVLTTRLYVS